MFTSKTLPLPSTFRLYSGGNTTRRNTKPSSSSSASQPQQEPSLSMTSQEEIERVTTRNNTSLTTVINANQQQQLQHSILMTASSLLPTRDIMPCNLVQKPCTPNAAVKRTFSAMTMTTTSNHDNDKSSHEKNLPHERRIQESIIVNDVEEEALSSCHHKPSSTTFAAPMNHHCDGDGSGESIHEDSTPFFLIEWKQLRHQSVGPTTLHAEIMDSLNSVQQHSHATSTSAQNQREELLPPHHTPLELYVADKIRVSSSHQALIWLFQEIHSSSLWWNNNVLKNEPSQNRNDRHHNENEQHTQSSTDILHPTIMTSTTTTTTTPPSTTFPTIPTHALPLVKFLKRKLTQWNDHKSLSLRCELFNFNTNSVCTSIPLHYAFHTLTTTNSPSSHDQLTYNPHLLEGILTLPRLPSSKNQRKICSLRIVLNESLILAESSPFTLFSKKKQELINNSMRKKKKKNNSTSISSTPLTSTPVMTNNGPLTFVYNDHLPKKTQPIKPFTLTFHENEFQPKKKKKVSCSQSSCPSHRNDENIIHPGIDIPIVKGHDNTFRIEKTLTPHESTTGMTNNCIARVDQSMWMNQDVLLQQSQPILSSSHQEQHNSMQYPPNHHHSIPYQQPNDMNPPRISNSVTCVNTTATTLTVPSSQIPSFESSSSILSSSTCDPQPPHQHHQHHDLTLPKSLFELLQLPHIISVLKRPVYELLVALLTCKHHSSMSSIMSDSIWNALTLMAHETKDSNVNNSGNNSNSSSMSVNTNHVVVNNDSFQQPPQPQQISPLQQPQQPQQPQQHSSTQVLRLSMASSNVNQHNATCLNVQQHPQQAMHPTSVSPQQVVSISQQQQVAQKVSIPQFVQFITTATTTPQFTNNSFVPMTLVSSKSAVMNNQNQGYMTSNSNSSSATTTTITPCMHNNIPHFTQLQLQSNGNVQLK
ncbi:hypothetical protein C9374_004923 [Naegleria lovaniensis]|uniref:Uncharacterized protein n=1 Tax=Naegleria lovaniensis TaxID=51637 RepID=A0AA88KNU1_NAELO|nr:uncharacterized protein C9374_004923 [Naegleria lovaniensis]KAG2382956.1 hypothetical protein C9374_004923 [Naegleria lovaniensis]